MRLTIKEITQAADLLNDARCASLTDAEFATTIKVANVICPILTQVKEQVQRIKESAKTADWNEIIELMRKAKMEPISSDDMVRVNSATSAYDAKVIPALEALYGEERDVDIPLLPAGVPAKLMRANDWTIGSLSVLAPLTEK